MIETAKDDDRLYAEDIAKLEGVSLRAAQTRLASLEAKHGPDAVGTERRGLGGRPRRYTTRAALARLAPRVGQQAVSSERRLDDVESSVAVLEQEVAEIRRLISGSRSTSGEGSRR